MRAPLPITLRNFRLLLAALLLPAVLPAQTGKATWAAAVRKDFAEPAWLDEGIVFVGNWEPLNFRVRHGGTATEITDDVEELYYREHRPETVRQLKEAGVNFIVTHFYKTGGTADQQSMEDTRNFVALCHQNGIRVGAYIGGTMYTETLLRDVPEARNWVRTDEYGVPIRYSTHSWRVLPDFNHPGYVEHMKGIIRLAVEAKVDLLHFDNMSLRSPPDTGNTPEINRRFREFLAKKYTSHEREKRFGYGFADISAMTVPTWHNIASPTAISPLEDPVLQEWVDFRCADFAEYYGKLAAYARALNPNIVVELNPHGIFGRNRAFYNGIDHARLLPHGSVFWSEEPNEAGLGSAGQLVSKIRSYKLARSLDQTLFSYTGMQRAHMETRSYRLLMAESMAFNRNSLGDLGEPLDVPKWTDDFMSYVRFYRRHNAHFRAMRPIADVAILRSFPSLANNSVEPHIHTTLLEQLLIQSKIPFAIVYDHDLADLSKYRVLLMGSQECVSDRAAGQIRDYVRGGGGLVATGKTSLYTEWRRRRPDFALADLFGVHSHNNGAASAAHRQSVGRGRVAYVPDVVPAKKLAETDLRNIAAGGVSNARWSLPKNSVELVKSIRFAAGEPFAVEFRGAPDTTVMEFLQKADGSERVLHWVNYNLKTSVAGCSVSAAFPSGKTVRAVEVLSPDRQAAPEQLEFIVEGGRVSFMMPELEVYQLVVISLGG